MVFHADREEVRLVGRPASRLLRALERTLRCKRDGDDDAGRVLKTLFAGKASITKRCCANSGRPTTSKTRYMGRPASAIRSKFCVWTARIAAR